MISDQLSCQNTRLSGMDAISSFTGRIISIGGILSASEEVLGSLLSNTTEISIGLSCLSRKDGKINQVSWMLLLSTAQDLQH